MLSTSQNSNRITITWEPEYRYLRELKRIGGKMFRTYEGYRIVIPEEKWEEYRNNPFSMDPERLHDFQQLAWTYVNQFDNQLFRSAVQSIRFFDSLDGDIHLYATLSRSTAAQYLQLITVLGTYRIIAEWVSHNLWYDPVRVVLTSGGNKEDIDHLEVTEDSDSLPSLIDISSSSERQDSDVKLESPDEEENPLIPAQRKVVPLRLRFTQSDANLRSEVNQALSSNIVPPQRRLPYRRARQH